MPNFDCARENGKKEKTRTTIFVFNFSSVYSQYSLKHISKNFIFKLHVSTSFDEKKIHKNGYQIDL
jgi:hypothetical protein